MQTKTFSQSFGALNAELLIDCFDYRGMRMDVRGTFSGTLLLEVSNDQVNWMACHMVVSPSLAAGSVVTSISGAGNYASADLLGHRYARIRCSSYVSGSLAVIAVMTTNVMATHVGISGTVSVSDVAGTVFAETTTNLAASATYTGSSRDSSNGGSASMRVSAFNAFVSADLAGEFSIESSPNGSTWTRCTALTVVAANTPVYLSVPVTTRYHRVVYKNTGVATQTRMACSSSYTVA